MIHEKEGCDKLQGSLQVTGISSEGYSLSWENEMNYHGVPCR